MNTLLHKKNSIAVDVQSKQRLGIAQASATFGEILQGVLPSNRNFLVTFPIQLYSLAHFTYLENIPLVASPSSKTKALKIAELTLDYFKLPCYGQLAIISDVPEGKGMASSSADLVATSRAIANCFDYLLENSVLESFMAEIEPSDGVMYDGSVSYYQREALLRSYLGPLPPIVILAIDEGGQVDTIQFSKKPKDFKDAEKYEYSTLLQTVENAIRKKDIITIGKVATRSAVLNQRVKKNKYLEIFLDISGKVKANGVAIAHSGTYIGLLFDKNDQQFNVKISRAKELLKENNVIEQPEIFYTDN